MKLRHHGETLLYFIKITVSLFTLLILAPSCDLNEDDVFTPQQEVKDEPYSLYFDDLYAIGTVQNNYMRKHLIDYFLSIAIGSEHYSDLPILHKWTDHMKMYLHGEAPQDLINEMQKVVFELNSLFSDGFLIEIVEDSSEANFHLFIGAEDEFLKMSGVQRSSIRYVNGYFTNFFNKDDEIYKGFAYVNLHLTTLETQKHSLREELTQSLGLGNDILYYSNSIFYHGSNRVTEFSPRDREIIKLLYHPILIPGLGEETVKNALYNLLNVSQ